MGYTEVITRPLSHLVSMGYTEVSTRPLSHLVSLGYTEVSTRPLSHLVSMGYTEVLDHSHTLSLWGTLRYQTTLTPCLYGVSVRTGTVVNYQLMLHEAITRLVNRTIWQRVELPRTYCPSLFLQVDTVAILTTIPDTVAILTTIPDTVAILSTIPDTVAILSTIPDTVAILTTIPDTDASLKALKFAGGRLEAALDYLSKQQMEPANGITKGSSAGLATMGSKLIRKPSLERGSPALDSGAGSSRSDSPRLAPEHPQLSRQYSPSSFTEPPPPPPPRCSSTPPPPPPPHPASVQHLLKRMSPAPSRPAPTTQSSQTPSTQRGNSPVGSRQQPMVVQNGPQAQQQLTQQMQALNLYPSGGSTEPPPPYPSYTASIQSRQSPTQDYRKSPSSGIYSGSPSPVSSPAPPSVARPTPLQAWGARQAKTQPPIIMQSVKSTQVQKPVLQTAIAPTAPPLPGSAGANSSPPPPSYATSIQQKQQQHHKGGGTVPTPASSPVTVPTTDPPSYASTMQALAAQRGQVLPPPPYGPEPGAQVATVESSVSPRPSASVQRKFSPATSRSESPETPPLPPTTSSSVAVQNGASERRTSAYKVNHQSPIPERKRMSKEKEEERRDCKVRNYSPQAFKFFMEQHIENVIKSYKQRVCSDYFASAVSVPTSVTGMWKEGVGATVANSQVASSLPVSAFGTGRVTPETNTTKVNYPIKGHHTCDSENLVYQLERNQCQAQYIGLTTETLRKRMNGHRHDTNMENKEKPVAAHAETHNLEFNNCYPTKVVKSLNKAICNPSQLRIWELAHQYITSPQPQH
uniref:Uncharacterized protein n=1 Tax=Timema poppense TaxID=170557 RepID=A0A7R9DHK6_TIMPO|nr:unnamed protein product [Timema poppensis]